MAWIESHQSLSRHRKTLEAVALLHVDRHKFIGHLHELWWWGIDNASPGGQLGRVPPSALADAAGWPLKDAQRFVDALVSSGFIERTEDGYVLHDWFDYAGKLNEQRALRRASNREAQQRRRQRVVSSRSATRQQSVSGPVSADIDDSQQPTQPDRTEQDRTGPTPSPSHRDTGTNPRAVGTNPRAQNTNLRAEGTNPRTLGTNPRAEALCRACHELHVYAPEGLELASDESEFEGLCARCLIVAQQRAKAGVR